MATNTYVALDKITVGTATPSITFTGINQGYTDLVVVINAGQSSGTNDLIFRANGDTASNYSTTFLSGTGSVTESARTSNYTWGYTDYYGIPGTTVGNAVQILNVMNYSNTTTFKTFLARGNNAARGTDAVVSTWRSTAAITSLTIFFSSVNILAGSTFSLYAIKAE